MVGLPMTGYEVTVNLPISKTCTKIAEEPNCELKNVRSGER